MGDAYPKLRADEKTHHRHAESGGRALLRDAGKRHGDPGRRAGRRPEGAAGRRRLQAARHLRLPAGPVGRRLPRARRDGGRGGLPRRHGQAEGRRAARPASSRWTARSNTPAPATSSPATRSWKSRPRSWPCTPKALATNELKAGQTGVVVLDTTPFYAESGGQVGDEGVIDGRGRAVRVDDTQKIKADVFGHHGTLTQGTLKVGDAVTAKVDMAQAPRHHAQPQRHPPDAQGPARSAGRPRAAEGLAGRCRQDALRLHPQPAGHRRADPRDRKARQRRDPGQPGDAGPRDGHRGRAKRPAP